MCVLKLSGKKTTGKSFSGETPVGGAPKGQVRGGRVISQVKGQRLDLFKADYASVFLWELLGNDKAHRIVEEDTRPLVSDEKMKELDKIIAARERKLT